MEFLVGTRGQFASFGASGNKSWPESRSAWNVLRGGHALSQLGRPVASFSFFVRTRGSGNAALIRFADLA
jgi:hypothetical protein